MGSLFLRIENISDKTIKLQFSWVAHKDPDLDFYLTDVYLQKNVPMIDQIFIEKILLKVPGNYIFDDTFAQEIGYNELSSLNGITEEVFNEICGICNVTKIVSKEKFEIRFEGELETLKYQKL